MSTSEIDDPYGQNQKKHGNGGSESQTIYSHPQLLQSKPSILFTWTKRNKKKGVVSKRKSKFLQFSRKLCCRKSTRIQKALKHALARAKDIPPLSLLAQTTSESKKINISRRRSGTGVAESVQRARYVKKQTMGTVQNQINSCADWAASLP